MGMNGLMSNLDGSYYNEDEDLNDVDIEFMDENSMDPDAFMKNLKIGDLNMEDLDNLVMEGEQDLDSNNFN